MNAIPSVWLRATVVALLLLSASAPGSARTADRIAVHSDDSLVIEATQGHGVLTINITRSDGGAVCIRNIRLDSTVNARIHSIAPFPVSQGTTWARVVVVPIDKRQRASAIVVIKDSTLRLWHVPYHYEPQLLVFDLAPALDFGRMPAGSLRTREVTVINPTRADIQVDTLRVRSHRELFRVTSLPTLPVVVPKDSGTLILRVEAAAPSDTGTVWDTLIVGNCCDRFALPLRVSTESTNSATVDDQLRLEMSAAAPNPAWSSTTIVVQLAAPSNVRLSLTDAQGREVRLLGVGPLSVGSHTVRLETDDLRAGVYHAVLVTGSRSLSRRLVVVK